MASKVNKSDLLSEMLLASVANIGDIGEYIEESDLSSPSIYKRPSDMNHRQRFYATKVTQFSFPPGFKEHHQNSTEMSESSIKLQHRKPHLTSSSLLKFNPHAS